MSETIQPLMANPSGQSKETVQPLKEDRKIVISTTKKLLLAGLLVVAYLVWGSLISLLPPFYPSEAEKKGATPSQVLRYSYVSFLHIYTV